MQGLFIVVFGSWFIYW